MKKIDDSVKKAKGTHRQQRERSIVSVSTIDSVAAPETLSKAAKQIWQEVATTLTDSHMLTGLDRRHLMMYCEETSIYWRMVSDLANEDDLIVLYNDKGQPVNSFINPKYKLRDQSLKHAKELGAHFGLTPLSRSKIEMPKKPQQASPEETNINKLKQLRGKVVPIQKSAS